MHLFLLTYVAEAGLVVDALQRPGQGWGLGLATVPPCWVQVQGRSRLHGGSGFWGSWLYDQGFQGSGLGFVWEISLAVCENSRYPAGEAHFNRLRRIRVDLKQPGIGNPRMRVAPVSPYFDKGRQEISEFVTFTRAPESESIRN